MARYGSVTAAASPILPAAVAMLSQEIPGLRCQVEGGIVIELVPKLQRGELDLVLVLATTEGGNAGLAAEVLGHESFVVVAGRTHTFAARESLTAADLASAISPAAACGGCVRHRWNDPTRQDPARAANPTRTSRSSAGC